MSLVYRQPTPPPGFPRWQHHPAGVLYAKHESCRTCGRALGTDDSFHTLWINLLTMDSRQTICEACAKEATQ